jgi:hypothetical protein
MEDVVEQDDLSVNDSNVENGQCTGCGRFGQCDPKNNQGMETVCPNCKQPFTPLDVATHTYWTKCYVTKTLSNMAEFERCIKTPEFMVGSNQLRQAFKLPLEGKNESEIYQFFLKGGPFFLKLSNFEMNYRYARTMEHRCRQVGIDKVSLLVSNIFRVNKILDSKGKKSFHYDDLDIFACYGAVFLIFEAEKKGIKNRKKEEYEKASKKKKAIVIVVDDDDDDYRQHRCVSAEKKSAIKNETDVKANLKTYNDFSGKNDSNLHDDNDLSSENTFVENGKSIVFSGQCSRCGRLGVYDPNKCYDCGQVVDCDPEKSRDNKNWERWDYVCCHCNLPFEKLTDSTESHWYKFFEREENDPQEIPDICYTKEDEDSMFSIMKRYYDKTFEDENETQIYKFFYFAGRLTGGDNHARHRYARTMEHRCRQLDIEFVEDLVANLARVNLALKKIHEPEKGKEFTLVDLDWIAFLGSIWLQVENEDGRFWGFPE